MTDDPDRPLRRPSRADDFGPWPRRRPAPDVMADVERSLGAVAQRPVVLAEVFYRHLFEMVPATRAMFADDMTDQMRRMTDTLLSVIRQLAAMDTADLEVVLHRMGYEHYERYGVHPEHYVYIAHALTRAVREVVGWEYSSRVSSCWIALCEWTTRYMISGARAAIAAERAATTAIPAPRPAPQGQPRHSASTRRPPGT